MSNNEVLADIKELTKRKYETDESHQFAEFEDCSGTMMYHSYALAYFNILKKMNVSDYLSDFSDPLADNPEFPFVFVYATPAVRIFASHKNEVAKDEVRFIVVNANGEIIARNLGFDEFAHFLENSNQNNKYVLDGVSNNIGNEMKINFLGKNRSLRAISYESSFRSHYLSMMEMVNCLESWMEYENKEASERTFADKVLLCNNIPYFWNPSPNRTRKARRNQSTDEKQNILDTNGRAKDFNTHSVLQGFENGQVFVSIVDEAPYSEVTRNHDNSRKRFYGNGFEEAYTEASEYISRNMKVLS